MAFDLLGLQAGQFQWEMGQEQAIKVKWRTTMRLVPETAPGKLFRVVGLAANSSCIGPVLEIEFE